LLSALYGVYGDLILYSILEYRSLQFGWNLSLLSFIISLVLLVAMLVSFFIQIQLLIAYQKIKKKQDNQLLEKFMKDHEGSQVFFKDFKDYSLAPQFLLVFLSGRDVFISLVLATMSAYPFPQALLVLISNCLISAYLFMKRPFESSFDFFQQLFFEFISLVVGICVFINAILDAGDYIATSSRVSIGKLIIFSNIIFNFVTALFMLFLIYTILKEAWAWYQKKRTQQGLKTLKLNPRLPKPSLNSNNEDFSQHLNKTSSFDISLNLESEPRSLQGRSQEFEMLRLQGNLENMRSQRNQNIRRNNQQMKPSEDQSSSHLNQSRIQTQNSPPLLGIKEPQLVEKIPQVSRKRNHHMN